MPRYLLPLLGLCVVPGLSFIYGSQPLVRFASTAPVTAQLGGLAIFVLSGAAFLVARSQLRDTRWLRRLTWLFLLLGGLYIVGRLTPELGPHITRLFVREVSGGAVFWIWLVALAFGQALLNRDLRPRWRLLLGALTASTLFVGLFQAREWVSGWLPPLVALAVTLGVSKPRLALALSLTGGLVAAALFGFASDFAGAVEAENAYSTLTRLEAWRIVGEIVAASPVLGVGPANYYWNTPLYSILGWHVSFNSHNNYVDIAAQSGLLGLACFIWLAGELVWMGFRLRETAPAGFARGYAVGALGGLAGMLAAGMLADWVLPFAYNIGLAGFRISVLGWVFLGGMAALETGDAGHHHPTTAAPDRSSG